MSNDAVTVTARAAPQWAWDIIDQALGGLRYSHGLKGFEPAFRDEIGRAIDAMTPVQAVGVSLQHPID